MIWILKWFIATFEAIYFGGLTFINNNAYKSVKTLEMAKNQ